MYPKKNYLKAVPGGENLMKHNQLTSSQQTSSNFVYFLLSLGLLISISSGSAYANSIKTHNVKQVLQLGASASNSDEQNLQLPSDVAVHKNKIYVVDGSHHRIVVYDLQGKFLFTFGNPGDKPGQLNYPVGIDVAKDNRVYVADSGNHRIQIFSDKGVFLSGFAVKHDDKHGRPIDVLRHSKTGNLIVSSSDHHLLTYSTKGKLLKKWGSNGTSRGEFRYPATLSELKDGRIAVVDVLNSRVQVFNTNGSLSLVVGKWGVLPGQLFRPKGIAIDTKGNFYISDSYIGLVQKYADDGSFSAVLGKKGKPYAMLTPVGMTINKNRLYVVEMKSNKVSVYQLAD